MRTAFPSVLLLAVALLAGCNKEPDISDNDTDEDPGTGIRDLDQYDDLAIELDATRSEVLDAGITDLWSTGQTFFWTQTSGGVTSVHYLNAESDKGGKVIDLPKGSDYRANDSVVATWENVDTPLAASLSYRIYNLNGKEVTTGSMVPPEKGKGLGDHWPYALWGDGLFIIGASFESQLIYHMSETQSLEPLETGSKTVLLEEDLLWEGDDIHDFEIRSDILFARYEDELYTLDISEDSLKEFGDWRGDPENEPEDSPLLFEKVSVPDPLDGISDIFNTGVLYSVQRGLLWHPFTGATVNITDTVAGSSYRLNETFADAHLVTGPHFAQHQLRVVYEAGDSNLYAYDIGTGRVEPIILTLRQGEGDEAPPVDGPYIEYSEPVIALGRIFVRGIEKGESTGPIYEIDNEWIKRP